MPRFVIGLEHDGHRLRNEIAGYIQESGQPNDQEHLEAIYSEIVSQIVHAFDHDFQGYLLKILSIPNFMTINYTDNEIDFNLIRRLGEQVRAFAIRVWNSFYPRLEEQNGLNEASSYIFVMDSVTADYLVLNAYPSNDSTNSIHLESTHDDPAF